MAEGISKNALNAALNTFEFKYREADFGMYPKGLMYGLQALDSWLYDAGRPFLHVEALDTFASLRKKAESGYFETLIKEQILDNPHKLILSMYPVKGLEKKNNKELAEKLEVVVMRDKKGSLSVGEKVKTLYKPLYCLPTGNVLNREKVTLSRWRTG